MLRFGAARGYRVIQPMRTDGTTVSVGVRGCRREWAGHCVCVSVFECEWSLSGWAVGAVGMSVTAA